MNNPIGFPELGIELNPSKVAFTIFGREIHWYGIIIAVAFLLAAFYVTRRSPRLGVKGDDIIDALLFAVPAAIIFARLYYVVFNFENFSPSRGGTEKIWEIWNGGIAIYGALIGGFLAVFIFCRIRKINVLAFMDAIAPGLLIGQCIGRWGNFINREAFGSSTALPWRMNVFVDNINGNSVGTYMDVHPTFLYESLWCLAGFLLIHFLLSGRRKFNGQNFLIYIAWYGLGRSFIEGLRADSLFIGHSNLRVSQVVSVISCLAALAALAYHLLVKEHAPDELLVPLPIKTSNPTESEELEQVKEQVEEQVEETKQSESEESE